MKRLAMAFAIAVAAAAGGALGAGASAPSPLIYPAEKVPIAFDHAQHAKLGATCPDSNDPSADAVFFDPLSSNPLKITHVFRVLAASLPKYTITQVSHNGTTMDATTCSTKGDCVISIDLVNDKGTKIWVIKVTTGTNGYFDW